MTTSRDDVGEALARHHQARIRADFDAQPAPARAKRGLHHKGHGVVRATVRIAHDLPRSLAVGVFVPGATYAACARFSTASFSPQPPSMPDVRGLGLKLLGVPDGPRLPGPERHTQDFVLMNAPRLMIADAAGSLAFDRARSAGTAGFLLHLLTHPRQALALRDVTSRARHLFERPYNSVTPFSHGPDLVVRHVVRLAPDQALAPLDPSAGDLRAALARQLAAGDLRLELSVQLREGDGQPLEDASVDWGTSPVALAEILLHGAGFGAAALERLGDRMAFDPWNGLEAHRPLGGLNLARRVVYRASSGLRSQLNGEPPVEPTAEALAALDG